MLEEFLAKNIEFLWSFYTLFVNILWLKYTATAPPPHPPLGQSNLKI